jgi:hypothetical protein
MKMTSNEETLTYKVVDLVESSNFHIKFTSITAVGPYRRPPRRQMYSFEKKIRTIYFCKIDVEKIVKKEKIPNQNGVPGFRPVLAVSLTQSETAALGFRV